MKSIAEWRYLRKSLQETIGFVPTMGNLHQGHLSLVEKAKLENQLVVVSIFVNPAQFNNAEDFDKYPRTKDDDLRKLEALGVDYCLIPEAADIYADNYAYQVSEKQRSVVDEGEFRPGHFDGVLTVVLKLLMLVKPQKTYFGEKDYQQYLLIKKMAEAFFIDSNIIACPTIRESSGLAFSSRNNRLNKEQRQKAELFAKTFHQRAKTLTDIKQQLTEQGIVFDYICERDGRRFAAVNIEDIRLIDNYEHESSSSSK